MARNKTIPGTIYGDELLLAFQYVERSYAAFVANPLGDDLPFLVWNALKVDIDHPYGDVHWYGEIAIRSSTRQTLEMLMTEASRRDAIFCINDVAEHAVEAASGPDVYPGLSDEDKKKLDAGLVKFLNLVAWGEIGEDILRHP